MGDGPRIRGCQTTLPPNSICYCHNWPFFGPFSPCGVCIERSVVFPLGTALFCPLACGWAAGKGQRVKDAKPIIRQQLLDQGLALKYAEPENKVVGRSGDVCVVAGAVPTHPPSAAIPALFSLPRKLKPENFYYLLQKLHVFLRFFFRHSLRFLRVFCAF